jgi:hypothetical protein
MARIQHASVPTIRENCACLKVGGWGGGGIEYYKFLVRGSTSIENLIILRFPF